MRTATTNRSNDTMQKIAVDLQTLQDILCCGRKTAERIGEQANARCQIGRRVLYNVAKVQRFLDQISE